MKGRMTDLLIYNTLSRKKEEFVPVHAGEARIYACGPTVYDFFHIGNGRSFLLFDLLRRYLAYRGYKVTLVQNFTDVDDKMIQRANREGITVAELAERFIAAYKQDAATLGIMPANISPRATEHIAEMIALIETLISRGHAYVTADGVYFDTSSDKRYGELSGRNLEELEAGARVDVDEDKKHPADFALWKAEKPGEPAWDSPFGRGRPGWHIECSAMSMKYLGETFDIHTGGEDLVFPHHENELAQSCCATGKPLARYWMHTGFLNIDNRKMSKSEKNFFTVRDIAGQYDMEAVRLFFLSAHYRSPVNFSRDLVEGAVSAHERLRTARDSFAFLADKAADRAPDGADGAFIASLAKVREAFIEAMDDDLNTAQALGELYDFVRDANSFLSAERSRTCAKASLDLLLELSGVLGVLAKPADETDPRAEALAIERVEARKAKNWAEADRLRAAIADLGYSVEDTPSGPKLRRL